MLTWIRGMLLVVGCLWVSMKVGFVMVLWVLRVVLRLCVRVVLFVLSLLFSSMRLLVCRIGVSWVLSVFIVLVLVIVSWIMVFL